MPLEACKAQQQNACFKLHTENIKIYFVQCFIVHYGHMNPIVFSLVVI